MRTALDRVGRRPPGRAGRVDPSRGAQNLRGAGEGSPRSRRRAGRPPSPPPPLPPSLPLPLNFLASLRLWATQTDSEETETPRGPLIRTPRRRKRLGGHTNGLRGDGNASRGNGGPGARPGPTDRAFRPPFPAPPKAPLRRGRAPDVWVRRRQRRPFLWVLPLSSPPSRTQLSCIYSESSIPSR